MAEGMALSTIAKAIIVIVVIIVAVVVFTSLASGGGGKLSDLFSGIPGLPEKIPVLETGVKLENESCRFSYECTSGFACWKGEGGGSGLGKCVKWVEVPIMLIINGKHVTKGGVCYSDLNKFFSDWIKTGKIPRESWNTFSTGIYVLEAGNDKVYLSKGKSQPSIQPILHSIWCRSTVSVQPQPSGLCSAMKIASDKVYVLKISLESIALYGGIRDSDCIGNSGYNSVVFYKISNDCTMTSCSYNG